MHNDLRSFGILLVAILLGRSPTDLETEFLKVAGNDCGVRASTREGDRKGGQKEKEREGGSVRKGEGEMRER